MNFQPDSLCDLLSLAAKRNGVGLAVDHDEGSLSYAELEHYVSVFASHLQQHFQVQPGDRIPLLTTHGTRNIVALLGILKTGASYVPMDRDSWSEERIETVLSTVAGKMMINTTAKPFTPRHSQRVFHFNDIHTLTKSEGCSDTTPVQLTPSTLACIIFTSGSTGKPKGVMLPHRSIINYAVTSPFNMDVQPKDRVLHILSVAFDASTGMLFSIIAGAGTIVPASKCSILAEAKSCSIWTATPSIIASFPLPVDTPGSASVVYPRLHTILLGGEAIPSSTIEAWCSPARKILNAYGPTESTVASLMHTIRYDEYVCDPDPSIIGKPMENGPVYLVDEDLNAVVGNDQEGEILVGGIGLADGYFCDPEKTNAAFIQWNGMRCYRTGDYGKWKQTCNGEKVVVFRSRKDRVTKNRGFLINLDADVQTPMTSLGLGIQGAHVTMFRKKLVALVYPATVNTTQVREAMVEGGFSSFTIPDSIMAVDKLPMTANGKVNPAAILHILENQSVEEELPEPECLQSRKLGIVKRRIREVLLLKKATVIDLDTNLLSLGASSLDLMTIVSLCASDKLHISLRDVYNNPTLQAICDAADLDQPISRHRYSNTADSSDSEELASSEVASTASDSTAPEILSDAVSLMTPMQLEFAQSTLNIDGKNTNQVRRRYALEHASVLEKAWRLVWTSEPVFKTQFHLESGIGMQIIRAESLTSPRIVRVSSLAEYQTEVAKVGFKVGLGAQLDIIMCDSTQGCDEDSFAEITVVFTIHHCLADGFAMAAILSKVEEAAATGSRSIQPSPPFTTAAWSLIDKQKNKDEMARQFWQKHLQDVAVMEDLGLVKPGGEPVEMAEEIRFESFVDMATLAECASVYHVTVATMFYTAWAMVVSKFTDRDTVTVGAVVSGRTSGRITDTVIGPLIATLPLVVRILPQTTVNQQLQTVFKHLCDLADMAWCSPRQVDHRVCSVVALQYDMPKYKETIPCLGESAFENTAFPLSLLIDDGGVFRLVWDPTCYSRVDVEDMAARFQRSLQGLCDKTEMDDCMNGLISEEEHQKVLGEWNFPYEPFVGLEEVTLQQQFDRSVTKHANLTALISGQDSLSYAELDKQANIVAQKICAEFPASRPIAIHADGTMLWIVGIMAIIKAGRPYCPLDPAYPLSRQEAVCDAANASGVLSPNQEQATPNPCPRGQRIIIQDLLQQHQCGPVDNVCIPVDTKSDAVIVFTSGTTGIPKGVPLSHESILALQATKEATMFSGPGVKIAQMMTAAFDVCVNEIFASLLHGGTLVLKDKEDPYRHLKTADITAMTPSLMAALNPADFCNLCTIYSTGEPCTPGLIRRWAPGRTFYNVYGPAETTIWLSMEKMTSDSSINVGRAFRGARMYVLDRQLRHQPPGAVGEIYLGGQLLCRGYLNSPEQTRLRFIPDPWHPGQLMYKTGDLGRWSHDGKVSCLGRLDRQIKVRGFRVELPSVERQIYAVEPRVGVAVVLCINDGLVAVVEPADIDTAKVKADLLEKLPPVWVPQRWVSMDKLPLTPNGKVDTKLLESKLREGDVVQIASPSQTTVAVPVFDPIANGTAEEWKSLLGLDPNRTLKPCDGFLSLGGHSILQMLLSSRLSCRFGVKISPRDMIQRDSFADQVALIRRRQEEQKQQHQDEDHHLDTAHASSLATTPPTQLSSVEKFQLFQHSVATSTTTFNIPLLLRFSGSFCRQALITAMNAVLASHDIFRSSYSYDEYGTPHRGLRHCAPQVCESPVLDVQAAINRPFDLEHDQLIRVSFWEDTMLLVASHMIADLNSLQNLFAQVSGVMNDKNQGLVKQTISDYLGLNRWKQMPDQQDEFFWKEYLRGAPSTLPLQLLPTSTRFCGTSRLVPIAPKLSRRLIQMTKDSPLTRHHIALGVVAQALAKMTGEKDLVLGAPISGRVDLEERESVGPLLDRLPIRIQWEEENPSPTAFLEGVRKASQAALGAAVPFASLMDILQLEYNTPHHPVFEVMVTFHLDNGPSNFLKTPNCHVEPVPVCASGAKFLIMFEWTEYSDTEWVVRIEYDCDRISAKTMDSIVESMESVVKRFTEL